MTDDKLKLAARTALTAYLDGRKMRHTPERFAILDKAMDMPPHFTIEALVEAMRDDRFPVSRATVYSTLNLLTEAGILRPHRFNGNATSYERSASPLSGHYHLVCNECGRIKEVRDAALLTQLAAKRYGAFHAQYASVYVYGICSTCSRRLKKSSRQAAESPTNRKN